MYSNDDTKRARISPVFEIVDKNGMTATQISLDKHAILIHLLEAGADSNTRIANGRTLLTEAVSTLSVELVQRLLLLDATVDSVSDLDTDNGCTPLILAKRDGSWRLLRALVAFGANVNAKTNDGQTVRHILASTHSNSTNEETKDEFYAALYFLNAVGAERCITFSETCPPGCVCIWWRFQRNKVSNLSVY